MGLVHGVTPLPIRLLVGLAQSARGLMEVVRATVVALVVTGPADGCNGLFEANAPTTANGPAHCAVIGVNGKRLFTVVAVSGVMLEHGVLLALGAVRWRCSSSAGLYGPVKFGGYLPLDPLLSGDYVPAIRRHPVLLIPFYGEPLVVFSRYMQSAEFVGVTLHCSSPCLLGCGLNWTRTGVRAVFSSLARHNPLATLDV